MSNPPEPSAVEPSPNAGEYPPKSAQQAADWRGVNQDAEALIKRLRTTAEPYHPGTDLAVLLNEAADALAFARATVISARRALDTSIARAVTAEHLLAVEREKHRQDERTCRHGRRVIFDGRGWWHADTQGSPKPCTAPYPEPESQPPVVD